MREGDNTWNREVGARLERDWSEMGARWERDGSACDTIEVYKFGVCCWLVFRILAVERSLKPRGQVNLNIKLKQRKSAK